MRLSALIFSGGCDENDFSALPKIQSDSCGKSKKKGLITKTNVGGQEGFSVLVAAPRYKKVLFFSLCSLAVFDAKTF